MKQKVVLDLQYLPPVSWWKQFVLAEEVLIEREENFVKSTRRNRCEILAANGVLALSIPLLGGRDHHRLYRETKISNDLPWQKQHWQSILSAYGSSPFWEHYSDLLKPHFNKHYTYLFDFNLELFHTLKKALKLEKPILFTETYQPSYPGFTVLRSTRKSDLPTSLKPYYQTFQPTSGFVPNLSVIDVLMNEGNRSISLIVS